MDVAALVLAGVGAVFALVAAGVNHFLVTRMERLCTAVTDGSVVRIVRSSDMYYPVIRYEVADRVYDRRKQVTVNKGTTFRVGARTHGHVDVGYDVGEQVRVRYDPDRPTRWFIEGDTQTRTFVKIFGLVGALFLSLGALAGIAALTGA
ncbi:uncharacterized protein DUF3592 [Georgenia soli]|uniref:Uncharacterized protein DUF3592 n=1 Tax=Georgenia soli TaxID=638953 RepID=A0A2A9ELH3_9MICO|nr:DUF3592 domain-containing protein [Georgenia soli]PFG39069.1 uncharacterized protein DUF3592 [Georgenia soli]